MVQWKLSGESLGDCCAILGRDIGRADRGFKTRCRWMKWEGKKRKGLGREREVHACENLTQVVSPDKSWLALRSLRRFSHHVANRQSRGARSLDPVTTLGGAVSDLWPTIWRDTCPGFHAQNSARVVLPVMSLRAWRSVDFGSSFAKSRRALFGEQEADCNLHHISTPRISPRQTITRESKDLDHQKC